MAVSNIDNGLQDQINDLNSKIAFATRKEINVASGVDAGTIIKELNVSFGNKFLNQPIISMSVGTTSLSADAQKIGLSWAQLSASQVTIRLRALQYVSAGTYFLDVVAVNINDS